MAKREKGSANLGFDGGKFEDLFPPTSALRLNPYRIFPKRVKISFQSGFGWFCSVIGSIL
jgi:hypothetical protein